MLGPWPLRAKLLPLLHLPRESCARWWVLVSQDAIDKRYWQGKWVRAEAIYTNRAGPNLRFQLYLKNIADSGPELLIVDTASTGTQLFAGAWLVRNDPAWHLPEWCAFHAAILATPILRHSTHERGWAQG